MTFWDWLGSPSGVELEHALLVLLNIIGVWLANRARTHSKHVERRLDTYTKNLMGQIHGGHDHC